MDLKRAAGRLDSNGSTDIRKGLGQAASLIGEGPQQTTFMLLSDGADNDGWKGDAGEVPGGVKVHTIGLSDKADRVALKALAGATGGEFEIARSHKDLKRIFLNLLGFSQGAETLLLTENSLKPGMIHPFIFPVDPGLDQVQFSLDWPGSDMDLIITDPNGKRLDIDQAVKEGIGVEEEVFDMVRIENPLPGNWKVEVKAVDVDPKGEPYTVRATASGGKVTNTRWKVLPDRPRAREGLTIQAQTAIPVKWEKADLSIWDPHGRLDTKYRPQLDGSGRVEIPPVEAPGVYRYLVTLKGTSLYTSTTFRHHFVGLQRPDEITCTL